MFKALHWRAWGEKRKTAFPETLTPQEGREGKGTRPSLRLDCREGMEKRNRRKSYSCSARDILTKRKRKRERERRSRTSPRILGKKERKVGVGPNSNIVIGRKRPKRRRTHMLFLLTKDGSGSGRMMRFIE